MIESATEFVVPQVGVIRKASDGSWMVWVLTEAGLLLVKDPSGIARFPTYDAAWCRAIMESHALNQLPHPGQ